LEPNFDLRLIQTQLGTQLKSPLFSQISIFIEFSLNEENGRKKQEEEEEEYEKIEIIMWRGSHYENEIKEAISKALCVFVCVPLVS
jgi:hypothetical protein